MEGIGEVLREQGRAVVGAFVVAGVALVMTMETWWLGWTLPARDLLAYVVVGLAVVLAITRNVSFRTSEQRSRRQRNRVVEIGTDFAELVLQSFFVAYVSLLMFGIIELNDPPSTIARLGLIEVVPLGFGAALANDLFGSREEEVTQSSFPGNLATFSLGAVFLAFPIAPTQEMERIAAHAGWVRFGSIVATTLLIAYLMLYELEFRGQDARLEGRGKGLQVGQVFLVYAVGATVSVGLLAGFGHFDGVPPSVWVQETIVLAFPAAIGASAAQVVL